MSLDPLRATFIAQATADADRVLAAAEEESRRRLAAAAREAADVVAAARREGEAAAEREGARVRSAAERQGRALVLQARRDVYDSFVDAALEAVHGLREDAAYPALLDRLELAAAEQLGEGAEIERDPPAGGGVRARAGRRAVDYSLDALAGRCVEALGPRVEGLWR